MSSMRILHTSDIHGKHKRILGTDLDFDVWVDTGDLLPNYGRRECTGYAISPEKEIKYQTRYLRYSNLANRIGEFLDGRPVVLVPGNHDFISLADHLRAAGVPNVITPTEDGLDALGVRWAGFRQVSYMSNEWSGEEHPVDLQKRFKRTLECNPDILVTHSPPRGMLSGDKHGIPGALNTFTYEGTSVRTWFFGHNHHHGGKTRTDLDVTFINGASKVSVHEVSI